MAACGLTGGISWPERFRQTSCSTYRDDCGERRSSSELSPLRRESATAWGRRRREASVSQWAQPERPDVDLQRKAAAQVVDLHNVPRDIAWERWGERRAAMCRSPNCPSRLI